jgi:hypothetical protein
MFSYLVPLASVPVVDMFQMVHTPDIVVACPNSYNTQLAFVLQPVERFLEISKH